MPHETASASTRTTPVKSPPALRIVEYDDTLAADFRDINLEWIRSMFEVEAIDLAVLEHPREAILDAGGSILFVEADGLGIVGACALMPVAPAPAFELTKMGVRENARGLKAGEFLLRAVLRRAQELGAEPLYLLTSTRCAAAVHLYRKLGFRDDAEIMARHGGEYVRGDVAMRYHPRA